MKIFIGGLAGLFVLIGAILTLVSMWDIYPISWVFILKMGLTLVVICCTIVLIWLISRIFFPKDLFLKNKKQIKY